MSDNELSFWLSMAYLAFAFVTLYMYYRKR